MHHLPESIYSKMEPQQTRAKCSPKLERRHRGQVDDTLNDNTSSMVLADDAPTEIFPNLAIPENPVNYTNQEETVRLPIDDEEDPSRRNETERKQSRLEKTLTKIKMQLDYSMCRKVF